MLEYGNILLMGRTYGRNAGSVTLEHIHNNQFSRQSWSFSLIAAGKHQFGTSGPAPDAVLLFIGDSSCESSELGKFENGFNEGF
jgi:hypothetical protein